MITSWRDNRRLKHIRDNVFRASLKDNGDVAFIAGTHRNPSKVAS